MIETHAPHSDLQRNIVQFCRLLRDRELLVTPSEVIDALRTAESIDLIDRVEMKLALRTVLTARREDIPVFDSTFDEFWRSRGAEGGDDHFTSRDPNVHGLGQQQPQQVQTDSDEAGEQREGSDAPQFSPIEILARRNFLSLEADELVEISRAIVIIARRLAQQQSRRYRATRHGRIIDLRRSFRRNIKYGGTIIELSFKRRKLRALDITVALERIAREVPDWSGGTRIGDSLRTFNRLWALRVVDRHTIVLVLSDGLDSGEATVLGLEMESIERRAARVIWLNPLLGDPGYRPVARTMRAALAHVQVFASAHNLESLQALGRALTL